MIELPQEWRRTPHYSQLAARVYAVYGDWPVESAGERPVSGLTVVSVEEADVTARCVAGIVPAPQGTSDRAAKRRLIAASLAQDPFGLRVESHAFPIEDDPDTPTICGAACAGLILRTQTGQIIPYSAEGVPIPKDTEHELVQFAAGHLLVALGKIQPPQRQDVLAGERLEDVARVVDGHSISDSFVLLALNQALGR